MISLEFHCDICAKDFAFKRGLGRYIGNVHEVLVFRNFGLFSYLFWFTLKFPCFIFMNCFMKFNFVGTHNRLHILKFISWFPIWLINRFNSFDLWCSFEKWLYIVNWPLAIVLSCSNCDDGTKFIEKLSTSFSLDKSTSVSLDK